MWGRDLGFGMENGAGTASAEDALGDGDGITGLYCVGLDWKRGAFWIGCFSEYDSCHGVRGA